MKIALLVFACAATAFAADPKITMRERTQLVKLLNDSHREFLAAVSSLGDRQWTWKPSPERWSVGECAEHIVRSEAALFARAQIAIKGPADPDWETKTKGKTELLLNVMAQRLGKATSPEEIRPTGAMSRAQIMKAFEENRSKTLKFVEETDLPLKEYLAQHPFPIFNPLNAYQWVLYIPLHNMRHDKQIEEVKASPGFPGK